MHHNKNILFITNKEENTFYNISIVNISENSYATNQKTFSIPTKWKLILMSDGSFTQHLSSFIGKNINTNICKRLNYLLINKKKLRSIWLEHPQNDKFLFSQSLWPIERIYLKELSKTPEKPIGKLLIEYQQDIYKDIHEIYYGYSKYFDDYFQSQGPIWGRKYTIYYQKHHLTTVHEFFSPELINFFNNQI